MARARDLLLPSAAGRRLGVTAVRIKQLEAQGRIRSTRVGGLRFYDPQDVERLLVERERQRAERARRQAQTGEAAART